MNFSSQNQIIFYRKGIENLVELWEKVVDTNRKYIID